MCYQKTFTRTNSGFHSSKEKHWTRKCYNCDRKFIHCRMVERPLDEDPYFQLLCAMCNDRVERALDELLDIKLGIISHPSASEQLKDLSMENG